MIDSAWYQEIAEENNRAGQVKAVTRFLEQRFGAIPPTVTAGLQQVKGESHLDRLTRQAASCPTLQAFEAALRDELPQPLPASTRGKRKPRKPAE